MIYLFAHGFKYGSPSANVMFDVSYFKNPWRTNEKDVKGFLKKQEQWNDMIESIADVVTVYDKISHGSDVKIAICCNAGEHRSPEAVRQVSSILKKRKIKHRTK